MTGLKYFVLAAKFFYTKIGCNVITLCLGVVRKYLFLRCCCTLRNYFPYVSIKRWISSNKNAKSGRAMPVSKCHFECGSQASHQSCPGQKSFPSWKSGLLCSKVVKLVASSLTKGSNAAPTTLIFG